MRGIGEGERLQQLGGPRLGAPPWIAEEPARSTRFSNAVKSSSTEANCDVRLNRLRTASASRTTSWPKTEAWPLSGRSNVANMRIVVVLPAPLRTEQAVDRATGTARSMPSTACVRPNALTRPTASIARSVARRSSRATRFDEHDQTTRAQHERRVSKFDDTRPGRNRGLGLLQCVPEARLPSPSPALYTSTCTSIPNEWRGIVNRPGTARDEPRGTPRASRESLTRDQIVAVAIGFAERGELDGMTMRAIAAELNVTTMALYADVADKDELLDEIIDHVLESEAASPPASIDWCVWFVEASTRLRQALIRYPALLDRYCRHPVGVSAALRRMETALEVLRRAGRG